MKFKPNANASKRTKNRFREHTIVPVEEFEGFFFKDDRTLADNVSRLQRSNLQSILQR
jgi:hypothetical protein